MCPHRVGRVRRSFTEPHLTCALECVRPLNFLMRAPTAPSGGSGALRASAGRRWVGLGAARFPAIRANLCLNAAAKRSSQGGLDDRVCTGAEQRNHVKSSYIP